MTEASLEERLAGFFARRLSTTEPVRVLELERATEGFSQETFFFSLEIGSGEGAQRRRYVAKREPEAGLLEPYDLEPEFRVLNALSDDPLPSPPTPFFERDAAVLERPFYVMERLPGDVPLPTAGADGSGPFPPAERVLLAPQLMRRLAELHAVDWKARGLGFLGDPGPGRGAAARELARWEERIARAALPRTPVLVDALLWLRRNVPESPEITLVHGDYRVGNWLVTRGAQGPRLTGILDWEMVHLGDPLEDLAWCSCLLWRAGTPHGSGLAPPAELAEQYASFSGRKVDEDRMRFYELLSLVKMTAIMHTGIRAFRDGRTRDLRMAIFDHQLPFLHAALAMLRRWLPGA